MPDTSTVEDPREHAEWFTRLPARAQDEFRAQWRRTEALAEVQRRRVHERLVRTLLEGAVILLLVEWVFFGLRWSGLLVVPLAGAAVGAVWHFAATDRFGSGLVAVLGLLLLRLLYGGGTLIFALLACFALLLMAAVAAVPRAAERMGA